MDEYRKVSFTGAYAAGDTLYVSDNLFNGLLILDKRKGSAVYKARFPEEGMMRKGLHGKVCKYGDEVIFAPDNARGVHIYNVVLDEIQYYPVNKGDGKRSRCIEAFVKEDKLWLFYAYAEQPVIIFDLRNHTYQPCFAIRDILPEEIKERKGPVFWGSMERVGEKVYAGIWASPYIMEIDMESGGTAIYTLEDKESKITGVAFDGEHFWIAESDRTSIKKWKPQQEAETITVPEGLVEGKGLVYCNILCHAGKVFLIPNSGSMILYIAKEDDRVQAFCRLPKGIAGFRDARERWRRSFFVDMIEEEVLRLYPVGINMMIDINLSTADVSGYAFLLEETYDENWYKQNIVYCYIEEETETKYLMETKEVGLDLYLDYVLETESDVEVNRKSSGIGQKVWKYLNQENNIRKS